MKYPLLTKDWLIKRSTLALELWFAKVACKNCLQVYRLLLGIEIFMIPKKKIGWANGLSFQRWHWFWHFLLQLWAPWKYFRSIRRHQRQITHLQQQRVQSNTINLLKYKKPAVTVLYVYGLFIIFYLPFCTTLFVETCTGYTLAVNESPMTTTTVVSLIHV